MKPVASMQDAVGNLREYILNRLGYNDDERATFYTDDKGFVYTSVNSLTKFHDYDLAALSDAYMFITYGKAWHKRV